MLKGADLLRVRKRVHGPMQTVNSAGDTGAGAMYRQQPLILSTRIHRNALEPCGSWSATGRTPSSTTCLRSPFSLSSPRYHETTPNASARLPDGAIQTERVTSTNQYNPQHWAPSETSHNTERNVLTVRHVPGSSREMRSRV